MVMHHNGEMQYRREARFGAICDTLEPTADPPPPPPPPLPAQVHQLEVFPDRVKLKLKGATRHKAAYGGGTQVCGARGDGDAAAQGLFLALAPHAAFSLACESTKQRNAIILLVRARARARGFAALGPKDTPLP